MENSDFQFNYLIYFRLFYVFHLLVRHCVVGHENFPRWLIARLSITFMSGRKRHSNPFQRSFSRNWMCCRWVCRCDDASQKKRMRGEKEIIHTSFIYRPIWLTQFRRSWPTYWEALMKFPKRIWSMRSATITQRPNPFSNWLHSIRNCWTKRQTIINNEYSVSITVSFDWLSAPNKWIRSRLFAIHKFSNSHSLLVLFDEWVNVDWWWMKLKAV